MDSADMVYRDTPCGRVKGWQLSDAEIYRGIPYAETARFTLPVQITAWDGVLDATQTEKDCWQYSAFRDESKDAEHFYYTEFRSERSFQYTESPMTLNIICPRHAQHCPVVIFIHGGGHETGTVGELPYGSSTEYAKRGAILVSVGYRLNVFSLYRSRNYGLHDQIAAIHWIHDNISAFGGNPERMILIGQSAGAMSITDLCYTQKLKGLIKGAVLMSGGGVVPHMAGPWTEKQSAAFWDGVCRRAGAADEEELKKVSPQVLWEAWHAEYQGNNLHLHQPGIDGDIIPDVPQQIIMRGEHLDIPMIFGVTSQDFMPTVLYEMALSFAKRNVKKNRAPVYGYMFRRTPPGNCYKAFHAVDLWYMFGNMQSSWRKFEPQDYALSAQMIDRVVAFAQTGNPNVGGLPDWPAISTKQKGFLCFDVDSPGLLSPLQCRRLVWHTLLRDPGPM